MPPGEQRRQSRPRAERQRAAAQAAHSEPARRGPLGFGGGALERAGRRRNAAATGSAQRRLPRSRRSRWDGMLPPGALPSRAATARSSACTSSSSRLDHCGSARWARASEGCAGRSRGRPRAAGREPRRVSGVGISHGCGLPRERAGEDDVAMVEAGRSRTNGGRPRPRAGSHTVADRERARGAALVEPRSAPIPAASSWRTHGSSNADGSVRGFGWLTRALVADVAHQALGAGQDQFDIGAAEHARCDGHQHGHRLLQRAS